MNARNDGRLTHRDPDASMSASDHRGLVHSFVGRAVELESAEQWLAMREPEARLLLVSGDTGSGKTSFVRQLLTRLHATAPNSLILYVDIANDEFRSSRVLSSLLHLALVPGQMSGTSVVSVPEELSLGVFLRKRHGKSLVGRIVKSLLKGLAAIFHMGAAADAALGGQHTDDATRVEHELAAYLVWASHRARAFVAIDNLQFLNLDDRLMVESVFQRVGAGLSPILVDRTVNGASELSQPVRCFADGQRSIVIERFTEQETREVVEMALASEDEVSQQLVADVYLKTGGLAQDIEYLLASYRLEVGKGSKSEAVRGLLATIHRLPLIHRQFLIVASLLDGGVDAAIARGTVERLTAAADSSELEDVVCELLANAYLRLNGPEGSLLRPGHERIVVAVRESTDEDLREEVRQSLLVELRRALDERSDAETEAYLLHCLVGLQTARELTRNIDHIARLIQSQHRQDQFSYLASLTDDLLDVLPLLPAHVLEPLFDSLQKAARFEKGLEVLHRLDMAGVPANPVRDNYRVRYLTQAYRYREALELSRELEGDEWVKLNIINTLMALGRDDEAYRHASEMLMSDCSTEVQAVLRRNTVHLYDAETALRHLDESYRYFARSASVFRLATIETNRGLVYLNTGAHGDAAQSLDRALVAMREIGSREIYQAQINEAIRIALSGDWARSRSLLRQAAVHVPRSLVFDQVKIDVIVAVIDRVSGERSQAECSEALEHCSERLRGIESPYLDATIEHNLATNRGDTAAVTRNSDGRVRLNLELPAGDATWNLPMSVHWRY